MKIIFTSALLTFGIALSGQLPQTDLYMLTVLNNGESISMKDPIYLSGFNPNGYNNQPYFINPREVYITTDLYDKQFTDFVKLDIQSEEYYRVTATDSISEYSPTPRAIPGYFSAVLVEKDGTTQSLWLYPNNHENSGKRILSDLSNVGYHCWLSEAEVALFLVDEPMKLAIGNIEDNSVAIVLEDIGRCFRQNSDGNLVFVHKSNPDTWYIKSYDPELRSASIISETIKGSEDFEILNDGTYIMASGSKLYSKNPDNDIEWNEVIDLAEYEISNITRLASSRNRIILVDNPKS